MSLTLLLADLPRLLEDIVGSVLEGADVVLIRGRTDGDLAKAARAAGADVVVVSRPDPADLACVDPAMARLAGLTVLAMAPEAQTACLHRCQCQTVRVGEVSATGVLTALRAADAVPV